MLNDTIHETNDDLIQATSKRFTMIGAFGNDVRVYFDVVAVVGDTKVINTTLGIRGHTVKSFPVV